MGAKTALLAFTDGDPIPARLMLSSGGFFPAMTSRWSADPGGVPESPSADPPAEPARVSFVIFEVLPIGQSP